MWVRSYWLVDAVSVKLGAFIAYSALGEIHISQQPMLVDLTTRPVPRGKIDVGAGRSHIVLAKRSFLKFGVLEVTSAGFINFKYVVYLVPYWFIMVLVMIWPCCQLKSWLIRKQRAGYCVRCGYDLRASTKICPECGLILKSV